MPARAARSPRRFLAAAFALIACGASAAPRLSAEPAFSSIRPWDASCAVVIVENDEQARQLVITGRRTVPRNQAETLPMFTSLRMDLAPFARKRVFVPLLAGPLTGATIEALDESGTVIALAAVEPVLGADLPLVGVMPPIPRSLPFRVQEDLSAVLSGIRAPELLPPNPFAWPRLHALVWDGPRSHDIPPEVARAIRAHVHAGGRLVIAAHPEEPDALERAGLGDLLPARPEREGMGIVLLEEDSRAAALGMDGALVVARGRGHVVLAPGPLDALDGWAWRVLLDVRPLEERSAEDRRRERAARLQRDAWPGLAKAVHAHRPQAPMKPAASLLLAFLVAAVPVDGWLTRRSLRRGRRSRWGALRYPVLVAAATLACWGLASAHAGSRHRMLRVDVVESGPDGHGRATTHLLVLRGQAGPFDVSIAEGSLDGVHDASRWMNDLVPAQHRAAEDPIEALRSVQIDIPPWKPVHVLAHWTPPRMPFPGDAGPCGTLHVGDADVVLRSEACGVAGPFSGPFPGGLLRADALPPRGDPAGDAPERIRLAAAHLRAHENRSGWWQQEESPPRLVVAHGSRLGPRITVDGIDTDLAPTVTLVRHFGNRAP